MSAIEVAADVRLATTGLRLGCRECSARAPLAAAYVCDRCFGPLEVVYDDDTRRASVTRERISQGPPTLWRYADLLPVLDPVGVPGGDDGLRAGWTPLLPAPRLAAALGLRELWLKDDTRNPTGSFKDRVVSVAVAAARALGFDVLACASTGNLAQAVAAAAARARVPAYVFVPADLEEAKLVATGAYGPTLVVVDGTYDDVNRLCSEVVDTRGWGFVNVNLRPFYAEGSKTIGFEVAEQLGWRLPRQLVAPMASGSMLVKIDKAFGELVDVGLVENEPWSVFGAQAAGCAPIATALTDGTGVVRPVKPDTIARSLAIGNPADGYYALDAVRRTGGWMAAVRDDEVVDAMALLARTEAVLAETAGGVTVAGLRRLVADGRLDPDATTVAVISGSGLKTLDALAAAAPPRLPTAASLDAFDAALAAQP